MASTYVVLRPTISEADNTENAPPKIELSEAMSFVESFLRRNGFSANDYRNGTTPCSRWSRVSSDQSGKFDTFASVCHHESKVEVTFSDWGRFTVSAPTSQLMDTLRKQLSEASLSALVDGEK